jgi:hypothetical protein
MEPGQAPQQPKAPQTAFEHIEAALEREEPEFQKAQELANDPTKRFEKEPVKETKESAKEPAKEAAKEEKNEAKKENEEPETFEIDEEAPIFETKYKADDGDKVEKLSLKQLKSGFMMQKDYQRKTAELARQKEALTKDIETKSKEAVGSYEKQLQVLRSSLLAIAAPDLQGVDLVKLSVEDPTAYVQKKARLEQVGSYLQHVNSELAKVEQAKAQEASQAKQKQIQEAIETLQRDVPDWGPQKYQELMKYGTEHGYSPQEMAETVDPRVFKLLEVAKKYEAFQKAKPEVDKKVASVPKVIKPGTADKSEKQDRLQEKWSRLKKDNSRESAASLIQEML